ncbi:MAG: hypothetical protein Q9P01_20980 [Anaerolineae bacterium]|nr:hypothetical protein [Anaerolineae bacterium]MDQ7037222.1 hypothetical protein [Anaerolineae bacterium]
MSLNNMLPFISTAIMLLFTISVFQRYAVRRNPAFLYWGIGLAMFGAGSFAEAFLVLKWNSAIFVVWYLFGAALNAAWLGHGTLALLVQKRWVTVLTVLLVIGSVIAGIMMLQLTLNSGAYETGVAISNTYREIMPEGAKVRLTTPFFNIYGLIMLVGGALYSAFLFWRKRVLPNRVIGNVLIAAGALSIGFASSLARLGYGEYLYIGELVAAVMMYSGFLMAAAPSKVPAKATAPEKAPSPA